MAHFLSQYKKIKGKLVISGRLFCSFNLNNSRNDFWNRIFWNNQKMLFLCRVQICFSTLLTFCVKMFHVCKTNKVFGNLSSWNASTITGISRDQNRINIYPMFDIYSSLFTGWIWTILLICEIHKSQLCVELFVYFITCLIYNCLHIQLVYYLL